MKIFLDLLTLNGEEFMASALSRVLPYVDKAVVVDTGSTDASYGIAKAFEATHPNKLKVYQYGSLAPDFQIQHARNFALSHADKDTTWYWHISDDEVYDIDQIEKLVRFLEEHQKGMECRVKLKFRDFNPGPEGTVIWTDQVHSRAMVNRYHPSLKWVGPWSFEQMQYSPNVLGANQWLDPDVYYWHFNFLRRKQREVARIYGELHKTGKAAPMEV